MSGLLESYVVLGPVDIEKIAQRVLALIKEGCPCCGYPRCGHKHGPDPSITP